MIYVCISCYLQSRHITFSSGYMCYRAVVHKYSIVGYETKEITALKLVKPCPTCFPEWVPLYTYIADKLATDIRVLHGA